MTCFFDWLTIFIVRFSRYPASGFWNITSLLLDCSYTDRSSLSNSSSISYFIRNFGETLLSTWSLEPLELLISMVFLNLSISDLSSFLPSISPHALRMNEPWLSSDEFEIFFSSKRESFIKPPISPYLVPLGPPISVFPQGVYWPKPKGSLESSTKLCKSLENWRNC